MVPATGASGRATAQVSGIAGVWIFEHSTHSNVRWDELTALLPELGAVEYECRLRRQA
jgi:hypothetical protein